MVEWTRGEEGGVARNQIRSHHRQGHFELLEGVPGEIAVRHPSHALTAIERAAAVDQVERHAPVRAQHFLRGRRPPQPLQLHGALRRGVEGQVGAIPCAGRDAEDEVGHDAAFQQHGKPPGLRRAARRPAEQDERRLWVGRHAVIRAWQASWRPVQHPP